MDREVQITRLFGNGGVPIFVELKTVKAIIAMAAEEFELEIVELMSPRHHKDVCRARFIAQLVCKQNTPFSISHIARRFGRDHSTVIKAFERAKVMISTDPIARKKYDNLTKRVRETWP